LVTVVPTTARVAVTSTGRTIASTGLTAIKAAISEAEAEAEVAILAPTNLLLVDGAGTRVDHQLVPMRTFAADGQDRVTPKTANDLDIAEAIGSKLGSDLAATQAIVIVKVAISKTELYAVVHDAVAEGE